MASPERDDPRIAGHYSVDTSRRLPSVGGLAAFAAADTASGRTELMAVALDPRIPARPTAFQSLVVPIPGLLTPVAYVPMGGICYAICLAPPGPAVQVRSRPWSEAELLQCVLRPAAQVLVSLQERGVTHRGIRLDNVFQAAPGQPVVLGTSWTAPPAMVQPALFEPPYSAMCVAAGRGEGTIADDVYALGVVLLCLALGHAPLAELDDQAIIRRKLAVGSFEALAGNERLSPIIGDLVRGMLAEDPEHRPTPSLLLDPISARGRRVAARPPRRAQRPLTIASGEVWNVRSLAHAVAVAPDEAANALRGNAIEHWLRRDLGDGQLAARVEETLRHHAPDLRTGDRRTEGALLLRLVALLDPLAPLCWRGLALWPDGLGTALALARGRDSETVSRLEEVVLTGQAAAWGALRADRCDASALRVEAHLHHSWWQQSGPAGGAPRLAYLLNPLIPCSSPLLEGHWVARLPDLLGALEKTAGRIDRAANEPVDTDIAAFISARLDRRTDNNFLAVLARGDASGACLAQLRVLGQLQERFRLPPLPDLAAWFRVGAEPVLEGWHNRERRAAVAEQLQRLTDAGYLAPMLRLLEDPASRDEDARGAREAMQAVERIDAELSRIAEGAQERASVAVRVGQEIAAGFGLAALAAALVVAALG